MTDHSLCSAGATLVTTVRLITCDREVDDAGSNYSLDGPVQWEPHIYCSKYRCGGLLTEKNILFASVMRSTLSSTAQTPGIVLK